MPVTTGSTGSTTRVANAPVNFGIYAADTPPLGAAEMLAGLAEAGYDGIDSGPIGYLGTGAELAEALAEAGLGLAGGWVDLRYDDPEGWTADLPGLAAALDAFSAVPVPDPRFAPRPTLACPPRPERFARPGVGLGELDDWAGFASRVQGAADRCRERGLEPVFHHHLGTDVETAAEVERLLETTDVSLCLDTGHLWLAGGDPLAGLRDWAPRIRQVHIKDASRAIAAESAAAGEDLMGMVAAGGFTPLGAGEVDLVAVADTLRAVDYTGWIVIEQDAPATGQDFDHIMAEQRANRDVLREVGI